MEEERFLYPITDGSKEATIDIGEFTTEVVATSKRDAPPVHYTFKIESFSDLSQFLQKTGSEKYESHDFEVGGYKWKLSLYPNGDKNRNGSDYISLYLVLSEANDLSLGNEVYAFLKLFAYDQIRDKYLTVQDARKKQERFHAMKTECGFPKFLPLLTFNDPSNGYLVDDCCIFGVEVFVTSCTGKGESVSIKNPGEAITYKMEKISKLTNRKYVSSPVSIGGHNCYLVVYPLGALISDGKYISLFLRLDKDGLLSEQKIWVDFKLRVKNLAGGHTSNIHCNIGLMPCTVMTGDSTIFSH